MPKIRNITLAIDDQAYRNVRLFDELDLLRHDFRRSPCTPPLSHCDMKL